MSAILVAGDPALTRPALPVQWPDPVLVEDLRRLHAELAAFRQRAGFGRAIAAPQLGIRKRIIALNLGAGPLAIINPVIDWRSDETFDLWDDCLSVPDRLVRVRRHRSISLHFLDAQGRSRHWRRLPSRLSELLQHEIDHLDGILMLDRAVDADAVRPATQRAMLIPAVAPESVTAEAIAHAASARSPLQSTPQFLAPGITARLPSEVEVIIKDETATPARGVLGRACAHLLDTCSQDDRRVLVAGGGQDLCMALATVAAPRSRKVRLFLPPGPVAAACLDLGADVEAWPGAPWQRMSAASAWAGRNTGRTVSEGSEPALAIGAGTAALELVVEHEDLDAVILPLGGGAAAAGVSRWLGGASPATRTIAVTTARSRTYRACHDRRLSSTALARLHGYVDTLLPVMPAQLSSARSLLADETGLQADAPGAAALAALIAHPRRFEGLRRVAVMVTSNLPTWQAHA